jgi:UDP-glucuronate decarboxylase
MHLQSRILVTGGAGFLGSHLCERLLAENNDGRFPKRHFVTISDLIFFAVRHFDDERESFLDGILNSIFCHLRAI